MSASDEIRRKLGPVPVNNRTVPSTSTINDRARRIREKKLLRIAEFLKVPVESLRPWEDYDPPQLDMDCWNEAKCEAYGSSSS